MTLEHAKATIKKSLFQKCNSCNEKFYSVFDRLWIRNYGHCYDCVKISDEIRDDRSAKIFDLAEQIV